MYKSITTLLLILLPSLNYCYASANSSADLSSDEIIELMHKVVPDSAQIAKLPREKVTLVTPPLVHEHKQIATSGPKVVQFTLTIEEKNIIIDNLGTQINAMTFNGSIPGPLLVVHQNDYVEVTLINRPENTMVHNINFHAATGATGGEEISKIAPGEQITIRFKATKAGAFIYHCAPGASMIPFHVSQGMNGAILVLPRTGLTDAQGKKLTYDKIYYIGESDFYVPKNSKGEYKKFNHIHAAMPEVIEQMKTLIPTHIVFNGAVGSLTNDKALTAKVGEKVLFVHSQANRDSRVHLSGGHGDYVWVNGKFSNPPQKDLDSWAITAGSASVALYQFKQPGVYNYLNHNLIEAIELGANAEVIVSGKKWDHDLIKVVKPISEIKD